MSLAMSSWVFCQNRQWALCDNTNPNAWMIEALMMGQTHVQNYMGPLLERIARGDIDPSVIIITHRMTLDDAPEMYRTFRDKEDECIKVVMRPQAA